MPEPRCCHHCDYELTGLARNRCPECGASPAWIARYEVVGGHVDPVHDPAVVGIAALLHGLVWHLVGQVPAEVARAAHLPVELGLVAAGLLGGLAVRLPAVIAGRPRDPAGRRAVRIVACAAGAGFASGLAWSLAG